MGEDGRERGLSSGHGLGEFLAREFEFGERRLSQSDRRNREPHVRTSHAPPGFGPRVWAGNPFCSHLSPSPVPSVGTYLLVPSPESASICGRMESYGVKCSRCAMTVHMCPIPRSDIRQPPPPFPRAPKGEELHATLPTYT